MLKALSVILLNTVASAADVVKALNPFIGYKLSTDKPFFL
jgi:hypothetical protein